MRVKFYKLPKGHQKGSFFFAQTWKKLVSAIKEFSKSKSTAQITKEPLVYEIIHQQLGEHSNELPLQSEAELLGKCKPKIRKPENSSQTWR